VPKGPDNELTSETGSFDDTDQPELFLSGGGSFSVPFDGDLKWTLATYNHKGQKTASGVNVNANSTCNKSASAGSVAEEVVAYPNPVSGKLYIQLTEPLVIDYIHLYDLNGNDFILKYDPGTSPNMVELDMSELNAGLYLIKLEMTTETKVIRILRK
jgi:hypothetical protein